MNREATATAHPNIALSKYWGKRADGKNLPAVPSLSVTLDGMATVTRVAFDPALDRDTLELGGVTASEAATARVATMLDRVRATSGLREHARVTSVNDFPTAAGLASSASSFAALAAAATAAAGLDLDPSATSDLARQSSVSAARSVFGGFVELPRGGAGQTFLAAEPVAPADFWDVRVVVAVTSEGPKAVGSTEGMRHTEVTSPYYPAWVDGSPALFARIKDALLLRDLEALGAAAEQSMLMMHAAALAAAPAVFYWTGATIEALAEVRRLRARGVLAFATIDAGPHVKVITAAADEARVIEAMRAVPGVLRTIATRPGAGVTVVRGSGA